MVRKTTRPARSAKPIVTDTYVVVPDLHVPFVDWCYVDLITQVIRQLQPAGVIQLGDALDFWKLSKFIKDPARTSSIPEDIEMYGRICRLWLRELPTQTTWHQLEGNHEDRMRRWIWERVPELHALVRSVPDVLDMGSWEDEYGCRGVWHPYWNWDSCRLGDTLFHHGRFFNKHVCAKQTERYPGNLVTGHCHRLQMYDQGYRWSVTLGCGANISEVMHEPLPPEWRQAFGLFTVAAGGVGELEIYRVLNGAALVRGQALVGVES